MNTADLPWKEFKDYPGTSFAANCEYDGEKLTLHWENKVVQAKRERQDDSKDYKRYENYLLNETFHIWAVLAQNAKDERQAAKKDKSEIFKKRKPEKGERSLLIEIFISWKSLTHYPRTSQLLQGADGKEVTFAEDSRRMTVS